MSKINSESRGWRRMIPRTFSSAAGALIIAVLAFLLGGLLIGGGSGSSDGADVVAGVEDSETAGPEAWTCSMHPQIQLPKQGKCPICFMDLIPVESGGGDDLGPRQIRMSETAVQLARIETSPVRRAFADREVKMVGALGYDETRVSYITAWVPGRIDELYIDYTGAVVRKGERMAYMYSPELYAVQEELLQAKKALSSLTGAGGTALKSTAEATLGAAREKLRLYGLSDAQIQDIEESGKASDRQVIYSPAAGIVMEKLVEEGMYVKTGTRIYSVADLSRLWVILEAYESDLPWLGLGQPVEFTSPSFPGETFSASITFIDPVVDAGTRTVGVRAEVDNTGLKLKPQMFVRARVRSRVDSEGNVSGQQKSEAEAPLLIPATAALITGERAVVYVEIPNEEGPLFEGREVELGPRAGASYIVRTGLEEGESVVTNGAFKIDSELQIQAKPSMMSPPDYAGYGAHESGGAHISESETALGSIAPVYEAYFDVQMALAKDDHSNAVSAAMKIQEAVERVDMKIFSHAGHKKWMNLSGPVLAGARKVSRSEDIETARDGFYSLSKAAIGLHDSFGHVGGADYYLTFCPMARDNAGAYWLQKEDVVWNSFYGESMLRCGEIKKKMAPTVADTE